MRFRCERRDAQSRQCLLAVAHEGKVPCRFTDSPVPAPVPAMATVPASRKMNKTEGRYATLLEGRRLAGELQRYEFEAITLRLAHDCRYTPDFYVITVTGAIEIHEVKGAHIWEDSKIKIKVAAAHFPEFKFYLAKFERGEWTIMEIRI